MAGKDIMRYEPLKIFFEADIQTADASLPDDPNWTRAGSRIEYRRYSVALRNHQRAVTQANIDLPDAFIPNGDNIDGFTKQSEIRNQAQAVDAISATLTMPALYNVGNHEVFAYDGAGGNPTPADFYSDMASQTSMSGTVTDGDGWKSYWYDIKGVRIVMLNTLNGLSVASSVHGTWLSTALDTPMPCVVVAHFPLYDTGFEDWTFVQDYAAFQAILEATGNVQCVLNGHYHWNNTDTVINNIPYISLFGQVLCPDEDDSAYYLFEIIPNAVKTENGHKPNIQITGYGSNGTSKTKEFAQYALF